MISDTASALRSRAASRLQRSHGEFELVEDHRGDTYRVAYTVRFSRAVYVLHCFQKKSPTGIRTARTDIDLIRQRLKLAHKDYDVRYGKED
ncbi:MAG: type II toxin-antitoxin system RelE/ParE family toxin [Gammaproteobacteria bacterium]|nr:type II toxin-antitoxin system RelE/ParE family toxin [Gammaproteobacteria bacterium]